MLKLNELAFVEECLQNKQSIENKIDIYDFIVLLCRYYQEPKYENKICEDLSILYPRTFWREKYIMYISKILNSKRYKKPLRAFDYIELTKFEMDSIKRLTDKRLQKLAATCLVLGKYYDNNGWIALYEMPDIKRLFEMANLRECIDDRFSLLFQLEQAGILRGTKRGDNINEQVILEPKGRVVYKVTSLHNVGNQLYTYLNPQYCMCQICGRLKRRKNIMGRPPRYCDKCQAEALRQRVSKHNLRVKLTKSQSS